MLFANLIPNVTFRTSIPDFLVIWLGLPSKTVNGRNLFNNPSSQSFLGLLFSGGLWLEFIARELRDEPRPELAVGI